MQQAQLLGGGGVVSQRGLGDQAVHARQEAVHALNALGGPHLRTISQSDNQSIDQSINQSIEQASKQSINQSAN